jgi:hypothetical protein
MDVIPQASYSNQQVLEVQNLSRSGLVATDFIGPMKLFMRKEAKQLWKDLKAHTNVEPNKIIYVESCPGVGKSVLVFAFVMNFCMTQQKSLLYYHEDPSESKCFVMDREGNVQSVEAARDPSSLVEYVEKQRANYDKTVIDGTHEHLDIKTVHRNFPLDKMLIICTPYKALHLNQDAWSKVTWRIAMSISR